MAKGTSLAARLRPSPPDSVPPRQPHRNTMRNSNKISVLETFHRKSTRCGLLVVMASLATMSVGWGQLLFWEGAGDGLSWTDSSNWSGNNQVPSGNATAYFRNTSPTATISLDGQSAGVVQLRNAGSFTFGSGGAGG